MKEIINFSTKFEPLEQVNPLITKYRINICVPDKPANKHVFSKEVIESMSGTIRGAGVYAYYFENDKQFGGHEDDVVKTKKGYKRTGVPVAYGFSDPYIEPYWMEIDGEQWYTTSVYLWTGRNPEIEQVLQNPVYHSMEVAVDEEEDCSGNKKVKEAVFLGFCLLQGIQPAFEGSTIEKFSFSEANSEVELLKQEYASFTNQEGLNVEGNKPDTLNKTELSSTEDNSKEMEKEVDGVIKEAVEKFSLTARQIDEILNNALSEYKYKCGEYEYRKYWVRTFNDELVFVSDYEDDKTYSFKYVIEGNVATIDIESKDEVIDGGFMSVNKKDEIEMSTEEMAKEGCEKEKMEDMSSNDFVDNPAMQAMNDKAAEDNKALAEENTKLKEEMSALKEKTAEMEASMTVCMSENTTLKEFKASIEKQNKDFEVETTLKEVMEVLSKEEIENCRLSAENFTLENISAWKNEVKAKAFNFSKGITEKKSHIKVALPISEKPKRGTGLWD